ncbi:MAG: calcium/proton exchanger [Chloroflexota bacterium]
MSGNPGAPTLRASPRREGRASLPVVSTLLGGCGIAGCVVALLHGPGVLVFFLAGLGIMPVARLLGLSTEALAVHIGPVGGALVMTFFGNAPELIIGATALHAHQGAIVKASIAGSILSNAMLVAGGVFLVGGWRREHITFNRLATSTSVTQLAIALVGLLVPAVFVLTGGASARPQTVLHLSIAVAVILIACYLAAQIFALYTHRHLFTAATEVDAEELDQAWGWRRAVATLLASTLAIGVLAEVMVDVGLPPLIENLHWTSAFVGVILVAVIGNSAELAAAMGAARHGKLELAVRVGIEGAAQVALLMGPVLVLIGALLGSPIDLAFPTLTVLALAAAVTILHLVADDGEGTWLEGLQLLGAYVILAVAFFSYS